MITAIDKNTALVLIDLQNGIVELPLFKPAGEVINKAQELVAICQDKKLPVIYVNVNPFKDGLKKFRADAPGLPANEHDAKAALEGMQASGFFDIVEKLQIQSHDIAVTKGSWNAFFGTNLHDELKQRNITGIILAGIATSIGVEGTARSAHELGYNITFAEDAMSDFTETAHKHSLTVIFPRIGEVGGTAAIIDQLQTL